MNASDHGVRYDRGWESAVRLFKSGFSADEILDLHQHSKSSYDIGARDCVQQFLKSGESEMIKIAACVLVIDPKTGYVLACTRRGTTDDWGIVGGKTDGEPPLQAALREFEEETSKRLIAAPDYLGCFVDEEGWQIHCFIVLDRVEAGIICDDFRDGPREVEDGILVGLVPYTELMVKTFGEFNKMLLTQVLKVLA